MINVLNYPGIELIAAGPPAELPKLPAKVPS